MRIRWPSTKLAMVKPGMPPPTNHVTYKENHKTVGQAICRVSVFADDCEEV